MDIFGMFQQLFNGDKKTDDNTENELSLDTFQSILAQATSPSDFTALFQLTTNAPNAFELDRLTAEKAGSLLSPREIEKMINTSGTRSSQNALLIERLTKDVSLEEFLACIHCIASGEKFGEKEVVAAIQNKVSELETSLAIDEKRTLLHNVCKHFPEVVINSLIEKFLPTLMQECEQDPTWDNITQLVKSLPKAHPPNNKKILGAVEVIHSAFQKTDVPPGYYLDILQLLDNVQLKHELIRLYCTTLPSLNIVEVKGFRHQINNRAIGSGNAMYTLLKVVEHNDLIQDLDKDLFFAADQDDVSDGDDEELKLLLEAVGII